MSPLIRASVLDAFPCREENFARFRIESYNMVCLPLSGGTMAVWRIIEDDALSSVFAGIQEAAQQREELTGVIATTTSDRLASLTPQERALAKRQAKDARQTLQNPRGRKASLAQEETDLTKALNKLLIEHRADLGTMAKVVVEALILGTQIDDIRKERAEVKAKTKLTRKDSAALKALEDAGCPLWQLARLSKDDLSFVASFVQEKLRDPCHRDRDGIAMTAFRAGPLEVYESIARQMLDHLHGPDQDRWETMMDKIGHDFTTRRSFADRLTATDGEKSGQSSWARTILMAEDWRRALGCQHEEEVRNLALLVRDGPEVRWLAQSRGIDVPTDLNIELPLSRGAHLLRQPVKELIWELFDLPPERGASAALETPMGFPASRASGVDTPGINDEDY